MITLDDNFLAYFNGRLRSRGALRTGVISSPYQQSFEINTGTQFLRVSFCGLNKQIKWLEISLIFDKKSSTSNCFFFFVVFLYFWKLFYLRDHNENKAFCFFCVISAKKTQFIYIYNIYNINIYDIYIYISIYLYLYLFIYLYIYIYWSFI